MKNVLNILIIMVLAVFYACNNATTTTETNNDAKTMNVSPSKPEEKKVSKEGYNIGDKVDDFSLKNYDGNDVSLASLGDVKGVIVTFTCNTCPYSIAYEDRLIELHKKYAPKGYPILAINPNDPEVREGDSFKAMKVRAEEKAFPFKYIFDDGQKVFPKWGATRTPEIYLLKKEGTDFKIVYTGAIDDNHKDAEAVEKKYLESAIEAIEAGKDPNPKYTKAIGCTIKVKKG